MVRSLLCVALAATLALAAPLRAYASCMDGGQFVSVDGLSCTDACPPGTTIHESFVNAFVENCAPQSIGASTSCLDRCVPCAPGSYSGASTSSGEACRLCAPGSFSSAPGATSCTPSPANTVARTFGTITPSACPDGTTTTPAGSTVCAASTSAAPTWRVNGCYRTAIYRQQSLGLQAGTLPGECGAPSLAPPTSLAHCATSCTGYRFAMVQRAICFCDNMIDTSSIAVSGALCSDMGVDTGTVTYDRILESAESSVVEQIPAGWSHGGCWEGLSSSTVNRDASAAHSLQACTESCTTGTVLVDLGSCSCIDSHAPVRQQVYLGPQRPCLCRSNSDSFVSSNLNDWEFQDAIVNPAYFSALLLLRPDRTIADGEPCAFDAQCVDEGMCVSNACFSPPVSRYAHRVTVTDARVLTSQCGSGMGQLRIAYAVAFDGVFATDSVIGPRSVRDLYAQRPTSMASTNLFGDAFIESSFVAPSCAHHACTFGVATVSRCRTLTPDGGAFNRGTTAANTSAPDGDDDDDDETLGCDHSWYMDVYAVDARDAAQLLNVDPTQPDRVSVRLEIDSYPEVDESFAYDVSISLLARATDSFDARVPTTYVLSSWSALTPIVAVDPRALDEVDLSISIADGDMTLALLDANDAPIASLNGSSVWFAYADLAHLMTSTPKRDGSHAPLSGARARGMDGFSVPLEALQTLVGRSFYSLALNVTTFVDMGVASESARRLLSSAPSIAHSLLVRIDRAVE